MRLSADISNVQEFQNLPKNIYKMRIAAVEITKNEKGTSSLQIDYNPTKPDIAHRRIRTWVAYHGVIQNGPNAGKPLTPFGLTDLLETHHIPWECGHCHNGTADRPFVRGSKDNGLEPGKFFCPDCRNTGKIEFDTVDFLGKEVFCAVDIQARKNDAEKFDNVIKKYLDVQGTAIPEGVEVVQ